MNERLRVAAWVTVCGAISWAGAALAYRVSPGSVPLVFALAGTVAGLRVGTGRAVSIGMAVTFVIGNVGAFLPIMATQASGASVSLTVFAVASAYGVGSAVGFLGLWRRGARVYLKTVGGFTLGGALAGVLLAMSLGLHITPLGFVALAVPFAVGGYLTAAAVEAGPEGADRGGVLSDWRSLAVLIVIAVGMTWFAVKQDQASRARGQVVRQIAFRDPSMVFDNAALYNGLTLLAEPSETSRLSSETRDALEVYVVVRFRDKLSDDTDWQFPEWTTLKNALLTKHADKNEQHLMLVSQTLGETFLIDLNRPPR